MQIKWRNRYARRNGSGKKLRCDSRTDNERRYSTLMLKGNPISSWKSGFLTGIVSTKTAELADTQAIILGDWL